MNAVSAFTGTVVGAAQSNAGALTVLSDASDSTYILDTSFYLPATVGFADPVEAGGRNITSAVIIMRMYDEADGNAGLGEFTGISPAPDETDYVEPYDATGGSTTNVTFGPLTPIGGGSWTLAQWNALVCTLSVLPFGADGVARMIRAFARVTYAT